MKKLLIISITLAISVMGSMLFFVNQFALLNNRIVVINDTIHVNNIIFIDTLDTHNDHIILNGCLHNSFPKPYLQASFINKSYLIDLTKDQWVQITGFDTYVLHDLYMFGDSVIIDELPGRGDYNISVCLVIETGTTGTKDKQLQLAISINDTIRIEGMSAFPVSKDNDAFFTIPSFAKYHLNNGDVIKAWLMNTTDNSDYIIINGRINLDKQ